MSPLPPGATRGRRRRYDPAKASTWLWVQQKSWTLQGPSALRGCRHTLTHTLGRRGKAHSGPRGRSEATGTVFPRSYTPLLHLFSSAAGVSSTCDTTDSLMLHYPYTSLSPCAASSHVPSCSIKTGTWTRCPYVQETTEARPHSYALSQQNADSKSSVSVVVCSSFM